VRSSNQGEYRRHARLRSSSRDPHRPQGPRPQNRALERKHADHFQPDQPNSTEHVVADGSVAIGRNGGRVTAGKFVLAVSEGEKATASILRTKVFSVEARAALIEATTAFPVNHESATRGFELAKDESAEQTVGIHDRQRPAEDGEGVST
jgi:hypothetical protein